MSISFFQPSYHHTSSSCSVCDGTQNVGRYRYRYFSPELIISDTDTGTFFGIKCFQYWFRDFFSVPNFPIPVPRLFPLPICSDTGSNTTEKMKNFLVPVRHALIMLHTSWSPAQLCLCHQIGDWGWLVARNWENESVQLKALWLYPHLSAHPTTLSANYLLLVVQSIISNWQLSQDG